MTLLCKVGQLNGSYYLFCVYLADAGSSSDSDTSVTTCSVASSRYTDSRVTSTEDSASFVSSKSKTSQDTLKDAPSKLKESSTFITTTLFLYSFLYLLCKKLNTLPCGVLCKEIVFYITCDDLVKTSIIVCSFVEATKKCEIIPCRRCQSMGVSVNSSHYIATACYMQTLSIRLDRGNITCSYV